MLLGLVTPTAGSGRAARPADAGAGGRGAAPGRARWSRARPSTPTSPAATNLRRLDAADRTADPRTAERADRRRARPGRPAGRRRQALPRLLAGHAAAARHRQRAAARRATCWCSTSRPTASTRRAPARSARWSGRSPTTAPPCWSRATCCPRSSRCAPTSASCTSGRLVAQGTSAEVRAGTRARGDRSRPTSPSEAARIMRELGLHRRRGDAAVGAPDGSAASRRRRSSPPACTQGVAGRSASASTRPSLEDVFVSLTGEGFDVSG